jgi:hypothetical protein
MVTITEKTGQRGYRENTRLITFKLTVWGDNLEAKKQMKDGLGKGGGILGDQGKLTAVAWGGGKGEGSQLD